MRKYITSYEGYTPICIPEGSKIESIDTDIYNYIRNSIETQFKYEAIIQDSFSQLYGNGRLRDFTLGRGLVIIGNFLRAIICNNGKVMVNSEWISYYPSEFKRFKKVLSENGYETRGDKCFCLTYDLNKKFFVNSLSPNMEDYEESKQLELSSEFLAQERGKLSSCDYSSENNAITELVMDDVAF